VACSILLAGSLIFLIERHKWGQGKYLLFNVDELLGTKADCLKYCRSTGNWTR